MGARIRLTPTGSPRVGRPRARGRSKLGFLALVAVTCAIQPVFALTPLEQTRTTLEAARAIVNTDKPHNQMLRELSELLRTFLDADTMGRAAVDKHWDKFNAAQQKEFLSLFRELFQRTYVQKLLLFEKPDFTYVGETVDGDTAQVDTKIVTPRDEFAVTYAMRRRGDKWMAADIKIEGLSLTTNFRRQLDRLLTNSSAEQVLERMRKKYGPGGKGGDDDL
jgi:phospholipid transport system substrate-binding protein